LQRLLPSLQRLQRRNTSCNKPSPPCNDATIRHHKPATPHKSPTTGPNPPFSPTFSPPTPLYHPTPPPTLPLRLPAPLRK
jgi:hypothetical protein